MSKGQSRPQAFFLPDGRGGQRFALWYPTVGKPPRALILYVHPFADEMNKTRRMAALQARDLAAAGCAVLQIDLAGCGDSSGDFGDASWSDWVDDIVRACDWMRTQASAPLWLWGLRSGCLLCVAAAPLIGRECSFLFWQPVISGKTALQQFLRLRLAGNLLVGTEKGAMGAIRAAISRGETIDVAGYRLGAALAVGLDGATLAPPGGSRRMEWLELSSRSDSTLSPAAVAQVAQWAQAGHVARAHLVEGPAFWQTTEIEEAPELLEATLAALDLETLR